MEHTNLVAHELKQAGFEAQRIATNVVSVKLSTRKVSRIEVEIALRQLFSEITFEICSTSNGVEVTV